MKVLILMGATAVGKSRLAFDLAERAGVEIISADSRQIYRGLEIGTAQPSGDMRAKVVHHLVDFLPLEERWSAQRFAEQALRIIRADRQAPPILVGGTGFWLRSLVEGLFPLDIPDEKLRDARRELDARTTQDLYGRLLNEDPPTARRLHSRDRQRILRALEVLDASGTPLSEHHRKERRKPEGIQWQRVVLGRPREELHRRIETRLEAMLEGGWPEEVRSLLEAGADPSCPGMRTLGYPELVAMLKGEITRRDARDRILHRTRRYARRQEIWFRKEVGAKFLEAGDRRLEARVGAMLAS